MISEKQVIKVLMPFPNDVSGLALIKHYYICNKNNSNNKLLFKCQTQKANLIGKIGIKKFREQYFPIQASTIVPFEHQTVVDKKQLFSLLNTTISRSYLTNRDIPDSIYNNIVKEILTDGSPKTIEINKVDFIRLNPECS
ncbi:hypothetical protein [Streptococcus uberis]|uniref:hypothetical protein n=1 Tax=Streptococcus uberis TaxID=1349 RepID=UPI0012B595B3|nr:hypothetical protein [Streptococcus uberis]MTB56610.1 hypothetical protein [Streptococcus uberis]